MEDKKIREEIVEEPIFEGGPTPSKVEELKEKHGDIYMTEFEDESVYIWKPLSRKEFKDIMKAEGADALFREERVCEKCVVWPENYDFMAMTTGRAGVPTILSEQIMDRSGFMAKSGPIAL